MISTSTLSDRRGMWAFVLGVVAVTSGVLLHAPMFWMGRHNHFALYGMPIGPDMIAGMVAIVGGVAIAAYGLLPRNVSRLLSASQEIVVSSPEDAPLTRAHWALMAVLVIALIIDIMEPASLGFTIPGMVKDYGVPKATASLAVGTNALIAMLPPYAAESVPLRIRGRTTGTVAACTKAGGMLAQLLAILALVPPLALVSVIIMVPTIAALLLVAWFGEETRGRDLRDLDPDGHTFAATGI
jgi:hypothetical protein